jgi:hypothetical protein
MPFPARWIRLAPVAEEAGRQAIYAALAAGQGAASPPMLVWIQGDARHDFALLVPRGRAPGRADRWAAWALSPALATCRYFGLPAYLCGADLWLHGRLFAPSATEVIGDWIIIASGMTIPFPVERHVEDLFRLRIEAQHDWRFETSWPTPAEADAIAEARSEFAW